MASEYRNLQNDLLTNLLDCRQHIDIPARTTVGTRLYLSYQCLVFQKPTKMFTTLSDKGQPKSVDDGLVLGTIQSNVKKHINSTGHCMTHGVLPTAWSLVIV